MMYGRRRISMSFVNLLIQTIADKFMTYVEQTIANSHGRLGIASKKHYLLINN